MYVRTCLETYVSIENQQDLQTLNYANYTNIINNINYNP